MSRRRKHRTVRLDDTKLVKCDLCAGIGLIQSWLFENPAKYYSCDHCFGTGKVTKGEKRASDK